MPNMALNLAPFGRWTLRDKAAQRRLALRSAARLVRGRLLETPGQSENRGRYAVILNLFVISVFNNSE
jgi:hypothetical protein